MKLQNLFGSLFAILVSWDIYAAGPNAGSQPTGYKVYYGDSATTKTNVVDAGYNSSQVLDIDISKSKFISVKAYNSYGESDESVTIEVGLPKTPTNLKVKKAP